jgi:Tol biopolymer transport system component
VHPGVGLRIRHRSELLSGRQSDAFSRVFDPGGLDLYVMRADGTNVREVTNPGDRYSDWPPQWSPDGTRLVFFREDTERPDESRAAIVFSARRSSDTHSLWLVHPNGTGLHKIAGSAGRVDWQSSSFSPSGRWIVSSRNDQPELGDAGNADVYVLRLDGSVVRNVTRSRSTWESAPDWGPVRS